jgi:hypothetical protein
MCQLFIAVGISGAARRYIIVDRYNSKGTGQQVSRLIAALVFRGVLGKTGLAFSEKKNTNSHRVMSQFGVNTLT